MKHTKPVLIIYFGCSSLNEKVTAGETHLLVVTAWYHDEVGQAEVVNYS